jgi:dTDP-4-amino-4,6-dideoxygalactose transaminase
VFVPDFTFFASAEVVALEGATPIFVDVDDTTYNVDVTSLERAISHTLADGKLTPKVIVAVDLFGLPANYPLVKAVAEKYNLLILEDGAQGFGGSINGQKACSFGDIATTSFFPAKPLGC